jgi:glycosyltransferase involved in cell wall biosynthesis
MRVLWILSADPNRPADGQLTYSLSSIEALAATGADVTVVHLGTRAPARPNGAARSIVWRPAGTANRNRLGSVVSPLPAMAFTAGSPEFRRVLTGELEHKWDAVVVDHVQSGWALNVLAGKLDESTVIVHSSQNDERSVRSRIATGTSKNPAARLVLELDARKVAALEDRILRRSDLVGAITEDDAAAFRKRRPGLATVVLPPGYDGTRVAIREITADVPRRAVIAGSLLWRVKQFDLLELVKAADARFAAAGAEIAVIGAAPPEFEAEVLRQTKATTMVGRVDSFAAAFAEARLALVSEPHGGGFKLKTLDYVFHRVPMLVQSGSVTGLPLDDGAGLLEYGSIDALVDGALDVLDDFETLNRLQNEAYTRCEHVFAWATRGEQLRDAIVAAQACKH